MPYTITKKGRNPDKSPIVGMIIIETFSGIIVLVKNSIEIIITNMILGIKDDTVSPYKEEISKCFRLGLISSNVILRITIAAIKLAVNTQNRIWMLVFKKEDEIRVVMDCNQ